MQNVQELKNDDGIFPGAAWPGAYAIAYVANDGEFICANCVNTQEEIHFDGDADGWRIDGYTTSDWHDIGDEDWICAHCNTTISEAPE